MTRNKRRTGFKEEGGALYVKCGCQVKYDGNGDLAIGTGNTDSLCSSKE